MRVKTIVDEDFSNYKKGAMFIGTTSCDGKCCHEAGLPLSVCQNDGWRESAPIVIDDNDLCRRYLENPLTSAVVIGGLEPFEQLGEVLRFIRILRTNYQCNDDIVIYTGFVPCEVASDLELLSAYPNIIVKFGRYIPDCEPVYDETLGVPLASPNQFARRLPNKGVI